LTVNLLARSLQKATEIEVLAIDLIRRCMRAGGGIADAAGRDKIRPSNVMEFCRLISFTIAYQLGN